MYWGGFRHASMPKAKGISLGVKFSRLSGGDSFFLKCKDLEIMSRAQRCQDAQQ